MSIQTMSIQKLASSAIVLSLLVGTGIAAPEAHAVNDSESFVMFNMADDIETSKIKVLSARIVIDAPPIFVWQTLTNYSKLKEILPGYKKTDVVSSNGNSKVVDISMSVARLLPTYNYRVRVNENKSAYEIKLNRISGDFNHLSANYQLHPKNNGAQTVLAYTIKIDPGKPAFPTFGLSPVLKNNTENTLKAIQNNAIQEHRKSLIGQR